MTGRADSGPALPGPLAMDLAGGLP
jgi:hypothetical protein